ncbi:RagB/SusD family nutrient uptake outer membrane protein [Algoriphagus sp. NG3]|uniref:RagB/SusD family nutrient uptake outer membrane protein n=1 Tax=Algoriphagus sp. NG3 TaxID=3097546 RepID=UPI002A83DACA|nr:RagB/SusD family nutrient uptake outer membrane protein [Algoriphagus sp. NG3]WPR77657.1 RagB/SusD family nutrient uptake outer membrane protein [Algoriphagus sp. NG3]
MKLSYKYLTRPILGLSILLMSCDNEFLGKPESNDVTVEDIFSERATAESFLWESYRTNMPLGFPIDWGLHNGMYASMVMAASDEGDVYDTWPSSNDHNTGVWGPTGNREDDFGTHYKGIRNANIFLENIDMVENIPQAEKDQMKAEAKVLRALQHHELMKRYGAIPIVDHVLTSSGEIMLPRNTYQEVVDFIVWSCDEAAALLPDSYPSSFNGRITKGVALALKGRVLLYAASPLHNTTTPYLPESPELTGYGNYDEGRWMSAANANKAVLDWAASAGVSLVNSSDDPAVNYQIAVEAQGNSEMLLYNQSNGWWGAWDPMFQQFVMPRGIYGGWYGHGVTLQHAQKYHTVDGTDQEWAEEGPRSEFLEKMQAMEPRFQYSVFYSGSKWNDEIGVRNFYKNSNGSWSDGAPVNGVGYMRKFLGRANWNGGQFNWIVFRLAEFYLNYAEALNETSPLDPAAFDALNAIRQRGGLDPISVNDPRYDTQEKLREAIRRERAVELAFEEHRFFDVRRWRIAGEEGVMKGQMWGLNIYQLTDNEYVYRKEPFESRVWDDRMYLYPLPQSEIDKGYLVQNPGW